MSGKVTPYSVLFYVPNLVGYFRLACLTVALYHASSDWATTVSFYLAAFAGDVVDGFVARALNQCSRYGGVLDMITDRISTCGLLVVIAGFYPKLSFYFNLLIMLDIASHWFHVSSVTAHHKSKEALEHRNPLLKWYYSIYPLFGYCCVGTELFYVMLYLQYFHRDKLMWVGAIQIGFMFFSPACVLKQIINLVQLFSAMHAIAAGDAEEAMQLKKGK